jgi:hypothetical protein
VAATDLSPGHGSRQAGDGGTRSGILTEMSTEAPLRAWLAFGVVVAVGAVAIGLRPQAALPTAIAAVPIAARAVLDTRALGLRAALPADPAVLPAVDAAAPLRRRTALAGDRRPGPPVGSIVAVVEPPREVVHPRAASEPEAAPGPSAELVPSRGLAPWAAAPVATGRVEGRHRDGWAARAGLAVVGGVRAAGEGMRTGVTAAAGALPRD